VPNDAATNYSAAISDMSRDAASRIPVNHADAIWLDMVVWARLGISSVFCGQRGIWRFARLRSLRDGLACRWGASKGRRVSPQWHLWVDSLPPKGAIGWKTSAGDVTVMRSMSASGGPPARTGAGAGAGVGVGLLRKSRTEQHNQHLCDDAAMAHSTAQDHAIWYVHHTKKVTDGSEGPLLDGRAGGRARVWGAGGAA
jgi:hypothetical protein